ncbi:MAG TPA: dual specificity protein phosphatase family protein [Kofleriaceae bacterium]|nr:dual specificity protein phosphatase family protein [Kofleriaceae bacterium]
MSLNLSWITDELAIGGAFDAEHVELLAREHRIGAVVDLREEACDDEALLVRHGVAFLHLPTVDHGVYEPEMLARGIRFVVDHLDAGRRALVHCQHGIGRSALLGLCVLVHRGHAPLDALRLAKNQRALVSPNPPQFEVWAAWCRAHRDEVGAAWDVPGFDAFAEIAYRHLVR